MPSTGKPKEMPFGLAIVPVGVAVSLLAVQLLCFNSFDPQAPLLFGIFVAAMVGVLRKWKWQEMEDGMFKIIVISLPAIALLILIGVLIGAWVASGTLPFLVYYGLQFITPTYLLASGFLFCAVMSLLLGTSWGTVGTVGIVIIGIGETMGFPMWLTAGAVVSGAFFGDKMSPISDTTNLAPAITGTRLMDHVKNMIPTTVPAAVVALIAYFGIGFTYDIPQTDPTQLGELLAAIDAHFRLSWVALIPPVIVVVLSLRGFSAIPAIFGGVISALAIAWLHQGQSIAALFTIINTGYTVETGNTIADGVLNRGGIVSMSLTISIVFFALTFGGILERIGCFETISRVFLQRIRRFWQLQVSAVVGTMAMIVGTGDGYLPMAFIGRLFAKTYDKLGYSRLNLSRAIEEGGTLLTPLVPWSSSGVFISLTLGLGITEGKFENLMYIPVAIVCWLSPLLGIVYPLLGWFSKRATKEEIESYSDSESIPATVSAPVKSFLRQYLPTASVYFSSPEIVTTNRWQDAPIPLRDALAHGDTGFVRLDGQEAIVRDGAVVAFDAANRVVPVGAEPEVQAVRLTHFGADFDETLDAAAGEDFESLLRRIIPSPNLIYAVTARVEFAELTLAAGEHPENLFGVCAGTVSGLYFPPYLETISGGTKLFFVRADGQVAGRLNRSQTRRATIELRQIARFSAELPLTIDFLSASVR